MIVFVSLEHESWFDNAENRFSHLAYCMDIKLKIEALTGQPCLVQRYTDVTLGRIQNLGIVALVISGNAVPFEEYDAGDFAEMLRIIRAAPWPILGFCGGHQLIAMAHGSTIAPMRRLRPGEPDVTDLSGPGYLKEWGFMPVEVVEPDPLLNGLGPAPVFLEVHYCEIKDLPPGFRVLASSPECRLQVIKQVDRPVYGTQFHAEGYTEGPDDQRNPLINLVYPGGYPQAQPAGRELLANFFRIAGIVG
jgi:GMP synthase (glutamine-hydrolysing)